MMKNNHSLGQECVLQEVDSEPEPEQAAPPLDAEGLSQLRVRVIEPDPHVNVQEPQEPQEPQFPSTANTKDMCVL